MSRAKCLSFQEETFLIDKLNQGQFQKIPVHKHYIMNIGPLNNFMNNGPYDWNNIMNSGPYD